jgi:hypothetical protein
MPTTFVKGDFLEETPLVDGTRAFAFGADVSGRMDAGIAVAMKRRWPALEQWWSEKCANGRTHPGDVQAWKSGTDVVYALGIQRQGKRSKVSWLERAARGMLAHAAKESVARISVPRLWGGETGLQGDRAKRVLEEVGQPSAVALVVFEQFIRAKPSEAPVDVAPPPPPPAEDEAAEPAPKVKAKPKKKAAAKKKATATAKPKAAAKKKATTKKAASKKPIAKKATTTKKAAKKATAKKPIVKKATTAKKATAKKPIAKKATAKKTKTATAKPKAAAKKKASRAKSKS